MSISLASLAAGDSRPLVVHLVFRFDTGGLENGVVNLINHMPAQAYRHMVVALTEVTGFRRRVLRDDVCFIALGKPPGHAIGLYPRLFRLFRELRPAVVHTRNLAALEATLPAWLARVPVRVHGEHGRDVEDLDGSNIRYQRLRRVHKPFVSHYVALSRDLQGYLAQRIRVPAERIEQIYNGVDCERFHPGHGEPAPLAGCPFDSSRHWLVGTVGRMQQVKDQVTLAKAFVQALQQAPDLRERLRLVMVGDGPLRQAVQAVLGEAGMLDLAWLPGERADVPDVMRRLNCFVLPSLAEGISNTILEAMATGLPVIATRVGGNAELLCAGLTGEFVAPADAAALTNAIVQMSGNPERAARMGLAGRADVEQRFSLPAMVAAYQGLYDRLLAQAGTFTRTT